MRQRYGFSISGVSGELKRSPVLVMSISEGAVKRRPRSEIFLNRQNCIA
jgi:hypothetical protein